MNIPGIPTRTRTEENEESKHIQTFRLKTEEKVSARPYLSVSERSRSQLSRREAGVPATDGKVYPCFKTSSRVESVTVYPLPKVLFFLPPVFLCALLRLQLSLLLGYYSSCRRRLSRPILSSQRALSSRFLRALVDTTLRFTRSEGARGREREAGWEEQARRRKGVTSRGRSD